MSTTDYNINLTSIEYNLLNDITRKTKTDCWFSLNKDKNGIDCVYDLENKQTMTLHCAIHQLNQAIVPELLNLSTEEILVYTTLLEKLGIRYNPFTNMK